MALWPLNIGASIAVASDNATEHPGFVENATADGNIKFFVGCAMAELLDHICQGSGVDD